MNNLQSQIFSLGTNDVVKGLVTAVFAAIVIAIAGIAQSPNFDLFTADWSAIGHLALNVGFSAFVGYLGKNFLSDQNGKVLGTLG